MKQPLLHILIIWSHGLQKEVEIVEDVSSSFRLLNRFKVQWDINHFKENLKRFYAHSLQGKSSEELEAILSHKMEHCGTAPFTALVFEDLTPNLEPRSTSVGMSVVNTNVFDKKAVYRKWLGGGHKIHASDTLYETNKDLSLLFGCSAKEFLQLFPAGDSTLKYTKNIVGVPTFNSIKELFNMLNQTIPYVVLRNYEALPEAYFVADHGDIDMLVENLNFMVYLTGAMNSFPDEQNRVFHTVSINNEKVPFDFRFVGDQYYDSSWELTILNNRRLLDKGFYVPDEVNYFYSLLYHAYVQKRKISPDYKSKLQQIAKNVGIEYRLGLEEVETHQLLHSYMNLHGYSYTMPKDHTVFFNKKFIEQLAPSSSDAERRLITSTISRTDDNSYLTEVFETKLGFLKIANSPIVNNEIEFLTKMADSHYVPRIISKVVREHGSEVLIEKIEGVSLKDALQISSFWTFKNLKAFTHGLIEILLELLDAGVLHRDIRPANILVVRTKKGFEPRLIDFGWSTYINNRSSAITPNGLGHVFKVPHSGFSDAYSLGKCVEYYSRNLPFMNPIVKALLRIFPGQYDHPEKVKETLRKIQNDMSASSFKMKRKDVAAIAVKRWKVNDRLTNLLGEKGVKQIKKYL